MEQLPNEIVCSGNSSQLVTALSSYIDLQASLLFPKHPALYRI